MKNILVVALIFAIAWSCSSKTNEYEKIFPDEERDKYYGYIVNDTSGLEVMGMNRVNNEEDTVILSGIKNNKLWLAKFDDFTKKCIAEYISTEDFNMNPTFNTGFGESQTIAVNGILTRDIYETECGFAARIILNPGMDNSNSAIGIVFNSDTSTRYYISKYGNFLMKWYNDSFLVNINTTNPELITWKGFTCFKANGDIVFSTNSSDRNHIYEKANFVYPISYDEYVYMYKNTDYQKERTFIVIDKYEFHGDDYPKLRAYLYLLENTEDVFSVKFYGIEDNILKLRLDVKKYEDGKEYSKYYQGNVKTWVFEEISGI